MWIIHSLGFINPPPGRQDWPCPVSPQSLRLWALSLWLALIVYPVSTPSSIPTLPRLHCRTEGSSSQSQSWHKTHMAKPKSCALLQAFPDARWPRSTLPVHSPSCCQRGHIAHSPVHTTLWIVSMYLEVPLSLLQPPSPRIRQPECHPLWETSLYPESENCTDAIRLHLSRVTCQPWHVAGT